MLKLKVLSLKARKEIETEAVSKIKKTELIPKLVDDGIQDYESFLLELNEKVTKQKLLLTNEVLDSNKEKIDKELKRLSEKKKSNNENLNYFKKLKEDISDDYSGFTFSTDITFDPLLSNQVVLDNLKSEQPCDAVSLWVDAPLRNLEMRKFENSVHDVYESLPLDSQKHEHNYIIEILHNQLVEKLFVVIGEPIKSDVTEKAIAFLIERKYFLKNDFYVNQWHNDTIDKIRNGNYKISPVYSSRYYIRATSHYETNLFEKHAKLIARIGLVGSKPNLETYSCAMFLLFCNNGFKFQPKKIDINKKWCSKAKLFAQTVILSLSNHWSDLNEISKLLALMRFDTKSIKKIKLQIEYWRYHYDLPDIVNKDRDRQVRTISDYFGVKKRFGFYTSIVCIRLSAYSVQFTRAISLSKMI